MASKFAYLKNSGKVLYRKNGELVVDTGGMTWVKNGETWSRRKHLRGTEYTNEPTSPFVRRELEKIVKALAHQIVDYDSPKNSTTT